MYRDQVDPSYAKEETKHCMTEPGLMTAPLGLDWVDPQRSNLVCVCSGYYHVWLCSCLFACEKEMSEGYICEDYTILQFILFILTRGAWHNTKGLLGEGATYLV